MKISNKDLIQSYVITTARYDFSVYEKRILYVIVDSLQQLTKGKTLNRRYSLQKDLFGDYTMRCDISLFLNGENDKNYSRIKKALISLKDKSFEYEDEKVWQYISIIESPEITKHDSQFSFRLHKRIYDAFLDFSKGYRKYELFTAMQFESVYAMRFYELLSGKNEPIVYSIDELKKMFMIEGKYKLVADFLRRVIEPAKKELDKASPYSFRYEKLKTGRKITHLRFSSYEIKKNRNPDLEMKEESKDVSLRWTFNKQSIDMLKAQFDFTDKGIQNNKDTLKMAIEHPEIQDWIADIQGMIRKYSINNKPGFFISQVKKKLDEL